MTRPRPRSVANTVQVLAPILIWVFILVIFESFFAHVFDFYQLGGLVAWPRLFICPSPVRPQSVSASWRAWPTKKEHFCSLYFFMSKQFSCLAQAQKHSPEPRVRSRPKRNEPEKLTIDAIDSYTQYIHMYTYVYVCRLSFPVAKTENSKQLTRQANRKPKRVFYLPFGHFSAHNY